MVRFERGKTYSHIDVQERFRFGKPQQAKDWINEHAIPYLRVNNGKIWEMVGDHIIAAITAAAMPHSEWQGIRERRATESNGAHQ
ncbi:hypothetical protein Enr13x_42220 [Stieleria neptunia]|uniref:DUF4224 domain-containing protein n=1 Tax=Stieleria neptunia TaxID=2527979 RepID=A0A518HU71_9BACT|nr:hypothetical protein [Stieleria neptunia]QDV44357.1 hypothetical protein Enr13x_42220 [Stieleria neptunia]